ncbi:MAG: DNA transposition protein [Hyphomicrobiales bacterium]|nr:MAG: DNA transposition protein [Hyphomicrobiales bacterium]
MAKMKKDGLADDLFDWKPAEITREFKERDVSAANIGAKYAKAIGLTLNECELTRGEIAMQMSDYLDEKIGKNMLDAYAAETRASHMIPMTRLEALIHVTGDLRLISLLAAQFKNNVVDAVYSHLIKATIYGDKIAEMEAELKTHNRKFKIIATQKGINL